MREQEILKAMTAAAGYGVSLQTYATPQNSGDDGLGETSSEPLPDGSSGETGSNPPPDGGSNEIASEPLPGGSSGENTSEPPPQTL